MDLCRNEAEPFLFGVEETREWCSRERQPVREGHAARVHLGCAIFSPYTQSGVNRQLSDLQKDLPPLPKAFEPGWRSRYSDSLRIGLSGDRIPVEARFSAPIQTGSEAHLASSKLGTGSFSGVKAAGTLC